MGLGKAPVDLIVFGNQPPAYGVALVIRSVGYILPEKTIVACNGLNSALARAVAPFGVRRGEGGAGEHSLQAAICSRLMKTLL